MTVRSCLHLVVASLSISAFAEPGVLMVLPPSAPAAAADALGLELALGHSPEVSLVTRGPQLEILRGLGLKPDAKINDALALKLGRLSGADAVIIGSGASLKLCRVEASACEAVKAGDSNSAAEELLAAVGAAPVPAHDGPWPDETKSAPARVAYAQCRSAVSLALEQTAVKGHHSAAKSLGADCQKALKADPSYLPAQAGLAAAKALADDPSAAATLTELLTKLPNDPLVPLALGYVWRNREDRGEATFKLLETAEQHALRSIDLRRQRAELFLAADMLSDAYAALVSTAQLAPRSPYVQWRLAHVLYLKGNVSESVAAAERAYQLGGADSPFYACEYASRLIDAGKFADAQALLEPLHKADPSWGRVSLRLGFALHMLGRSADAIALLEAASKAKPRDEREATDPTFARLDLARAHAKLGHSKLALQQLQAVQKAGMLDAASLKEADFDSIRATPEFQKLPGALGR